MTLELPLAGSKRPAGNNPQRQHDDQQYGAGTDRHERLEHKPSVEVDSIQRAYTSRRRVGKQPTVQQHYPSTRARHTALEYRNRVRGLFTAAKEVVSVGVG